MGLPAIILSHGLPTLGAQTNQDRKEEGRRGDDHGRRVERKIDGFRKAEDREGEDDRRHADEEDDERQQPNRRREGPSRVAAPVGEPIELREGSVRQGGEQPEEGEDRRDGSVRQEDHAAEDDREGEAGDLRDDRGDSRMNPPDEEGQRRREDEERPGGRQEGTSLKVKTQRQRIVEGNGEGGKWQGKENAGDDGTGAAPRHFVDRRSLDREGWHHQQDREDRERREIESAKEPDGGAEREAEEDLRRGARPAGEVRRDREENPDHREGECRARPNRQRREDEGHERGRRRGPPRISSVQPSLKGRWTPAVTTPTRIVGY